jgi:hypothetical protein
MTSPTSNPHVEVGIWYVVKVKSAIGYLSRGTAELQRTNMKTLQSHPFKRCKCVKYKSIKCRVLYLSEPVDKLCMFQGSGKGVRMYTVMG